MGTDDTDKIERRLQDGVKTFAEHGGRLNALEKDLVKLEGHLKEDLLELKGELKELALSQRELRDRVLRLATIIGLAGTIGGALVGAIAAALMRSVIP